MVLVQILLDNSVIITFGSHLKSDIGWRGQEKESCPVT